MKRFVLLFVVAAALVAAVGAGGYSLGRSVDVRPGGSAVFLPHHWQCSNAGRTIGCQTGDACPWAELTGTQSGGVTVRVHTASGGGVRVRVVRHSDLPGGAPSNEIVYTFSAF